MQQSFEKFIKLFYSPIFFSIYVVLIICSYLFFDKNIAYYFHNLDLSSIKPLLKIISMGAKSSLYVVFLFVGFLLARCYFKKPYIANSFLFCWLSLLFAGAICFISKTILGRARPSELFNHDLYGFQFFKTNPDFWSFPSGHTTVISSVMISLCYIKPRYWPLFVIIALLITSTRLILTAHFLSDVLCAFYLSVFAVSYLYDYLITSGTLTLTENNV